MAQTILVIAEQREGEIRKVTYEALGEASRLAQTMGGDVVALLAGSNVKDKAASLGHYGAKTVFVADDDRLTPLLRRVQHLLEKVGKELTSFGQIRNAG